jgi:hypothetical protein
MLTAPRLSVHPLQRANMSVGEQMGYVRDFHIEATKRGPIADPVIDTVFDGTRVDVIVGCLDKGRLAVCCDVSMHTVAKPIPSFSTTPVAGSAPVTIQLPRVTSIRLQQKSVVPDGGGLVLATRKADGNWLCVVLDATSTK